MKIQQTHRASLLALTMLFALPASLMAADGKWDRMLDALHHNTAAVSHISKQDRAILEATILLKAHRPEQAASILEKQSETPLIKQLKVQAAREHLVEVVRRAGGTRSEVKLPAPSEGLTKALAEVDARLNSLMQALAPVQQDKAGQPVQLAAGHGHAGSAAQSAQPAVQDISRTFLEKMAPAKRWAYLLNELRHNQLRVSKHLSRQDKAVLITAVLLKAGEPVQALKELETQPSGDLTKYLKTKAKQERIIKAVIRAGGSRSEVRLPAESAAMSDALASVDARLQSFMHQLDQEKARPARVTRHIARAARKTAVSPGPSKQNTKPTAVAQLVKQPAMAGETEKVADIELPVSPELHDAVLQVVEAWRSAWSNRDLDAYFAVYADDFEVNDRFASMDAWKAYKRWVIGKRSSIEVTLDLIQLHHVSADTVRVEFLQHFRADDYESNDLKALTLKRYGSGWKIVSEASI